jgi:hypothetical protein
MSDTTGETEIIGRNERGQFGPGNQCSAGRSSRAAELKRAFTEAVTEDDVAEIARTLVRQAIDGDTAAAKLVLARVCGKPDGVPVVAIQMSQASGPDERRSKYGHLIERVREERQEPGRAMAIVERLRAQEAERAARGEVEEPVNPEERAPLKPEILKIIQRLQRPDTVKLAENV